MPGSLEFFTLYHRGRVVKYKRIDFVNFLGELLELIDKGHRVYMTDVHLLLATLVWNRQLFGKKALLIRDAIWARKLVSLNDLTTTAHGIRGVRSLLEKTSHIPDISDLARESESFERWLLKKWGEGLGQHLGAHVETLGRAGALCVTWNGTLIDQDLLKSGLEIFQSKELRGLETTLASHYRQVYQALRADGRVHPVYVRQNTYRLGSLWPNIQNFSTSGGELSSKRLILAGEEKQLVGYDVKMAELFAVAQRWADLYPSDPKARTLLEELNSGLDIHYESGKKLVGDSDSLTTEKQIRQIGKIANFATLNMSRIDRINDNLLRQNLPRVSRQRYDGLMQHLYSRYPLRRWHDEAGFKSRKRKVETSYGRQIYVYRPQQYTGFQFQTPTGDAFGVAILELALAGYIPNLIIHDEALIGLPLDADLEEINQIYLKGFGRLLPETAPKTKVSIYDNRWGVPSRTLTV